MTKTFSSIAILFLSVIALCNGQKINEHHKFNTDSLLHHVKVLSSDRFEGRRTGTSGGQMAENYIIKKLNALNIQPFIENYQQAFSFKSKVNTYDGVNILGVIKGATNPDDYIVISAHYDHEGIKNDQIYNGADDDASGISALFAFAEYFKKHPPKHSIILAAFDAEELGLMGSKYFVENSIVPLDHIKLNMNMDMISRNDKNELYVTGTVFNDTLKEVISNFKNPEDFKLLMGHDGKDGLENWIYSSDHGPFHMKNIPFLYFGEEDHKDYHQPTDDFENIQPKFYINAVSSIISIFETLDAMNL